MDPKRDMDERVNSDADPIDLIKTFLEMEPLPGEPTDEEVGES